MIRKQNPESDGMELGWIRVRTRKEYRSPTMEVVLERPKEKVKKGGCLWKNWLS